MASYRPQDLLQFINHTDEDVDCEFSDDGIVTLLDHDGSTVNHVTSGSSPCRKRPHSQTFHPDEHSPRSSGSPENGKGSKKLTRGKQKIPIEFIHDRARRYSTFSKRKTGLMKKASELAHLTGAQVLLLIASETKHVYTFATQRLKDIVNLDSGKELIKTCLMGPHPSTGVEASVKKRSVSTSTNSSDTSNCTEKTAFEASTYDSNSQNNTRFGSQGFSISGFAEHERYSCNAETKSLRDQVPQSDTLTMNKPATPNDLCVQSTPVAAEGIHPGVDHSPVPDHNQVTSPSTVATSVAAFGINYANARIETVNPPSSSLTGILVNSSMSNSVDPVQLLLLSHPNPPTSVGETNASVISARPTATSTAVPNNPLVSGVDHLYPHTPISTSPTPCIISPMPRRTLLPKKPK